MKTSLQLKLGQQLAMTPQLQQAIRLLQLSTLDLQQEIQEALDANPLLELDESHPDGDTPSSDADDIHADGKNDAAEQYEDISSDSFDTSDVIEQREMPA